MVDKEQSLLVGLAGTSSTDAMRSHSFESYRVLTLSCTAPVPISPLMSSSRPTSLLPLPRPARGWMSLKQARPLGATMARITSEIPAADEGDVAGVDMTHMVVPITSDRGLCGGVNGAVIKAAKVLCNGLKGDITFALLGNKGEALLRRTHGQMIQRVITEIYQNPTSFALASEIAEEISTTKTYDKAHIIYNRFKSAIAYDTLCDEVDSSGKYHL